MILELLWAAGKYRWMGFDDEDEHPVNGQFTSYLPSDLGLNLEVPGHALFLRALLFAVVLL